jgi:hypothetical protein
MGRVLRRLSRPLKICGFLVGPGRCDAKTMDLPLFHTLLQIRLQWGICNKSRLRLQPSRESLQIKIQMRTSVGEPPSRRPATIPRDENLEANSRRRRKAQGTEATTRSIRTSATRRYDGGGTSRSLKGHFIRGCESNLGRWFSRIIIVVRKLEISRRTARFVCARHSPPRRCE